MALNVELRARPYLGTPFRVAITEFVSLGGRREINVRATVVRNVQPRHLAISDHRIARVLSYEQEKLVQFADRLHWGYPVLVSKGVALVVSGVSPGGPRPRSGEVFLGPSAE